MPRWIVKLSRIGSNDLKRSMVTACCSRGYLFANCMDDRNMIMNRDVHQNIYIPPLWCHARRYVQSRREAREAYINRNLGLFGKNGSWKLQKFGIICTYYQLSKELEWKEAQNLTAFSRQILATSANSCLSYPNILTTGFLNSYDSGKDEPSLINDVLAFRFSETFNNQSESTKELFSVMLVSFSSSTMMECLHFIGVLWNKIIYPYQKL